MIEEAVLQPLVRKLETLEDLSDLETQAVLSIFCADVREVNRKRVIVSEGSVPSSTHIIVKGWAVRYKLVPDGARRITAILLPGDFCVIHTSALAKMDHSILAVTDCQVAHVSPKKIDEITQSSPVLTRALWRSTLVDEAILRQWLVNSGRRDAFTGVAHLFCELHLRLKLIGEVVDERRTRVPLTQEDIGDAAGLTAVHVNRTLARLRDDGLMTLQGGTLDIPDITALERACGFDPSYLHPRRAS